MPEENQPLESPIHRAAHLGDIAALERLVADGADVNARSDFADDGYYLGSVTPLMVAAHSLDGADVQTLAWLLDHGADLYATSPDDVTAAWYAATKGERWRGDDSWHITPNHVERLRFLLDSGLDPNETMSNGRSLLTEACSAGDPAKVRLLLERSVSPFPIDESDPDWIKWFKEHRETQGLPDAGNFFPHRIPLFCAATSGSPECVQLLLDAGADLNMRDWMSRTVLAYAGSPEVARLLITAGHKLEDLLELMLDGGVSGDIPISTRYELAQFFLDAGIPLERTSETGWTRLYHAAFRTQAETVEWLLAHGASLAPTNDNSTPLHGVCWQGEQGDQEAADCERIIRMLVAAGIPIEARDDEGRTPLHKATGGDWGNVTAVRTLLELGAEPDPVDVYGQTPLHLAADRGPSANVQALLAASADPIRRDKNDATPLDYSAKHEQSWREFASRDTPLPVVTEDLETRQAWSQARLDDAIAGRTLLAAAADSRNAP